MVRPHYESLQPSSRVFLLDVVGELCSLANELIRESGVKTFYRFLAAEFLLINEWLLAQPVDFWDTVRARTRVSKLLDNLERLCMASNFIPGLFADH